MYGGNPEAVVRDVVAGHHLIISEYIIEEVIAGVKELAGKPPQRWLKQLRLKLMRLASDDTYRVPEDVRDIKDEPVIGLATKYKAVLITGDKDLLEYKPLLHMPILTPAEYVEIFELEELG